MSRSTKKKPKSEVPAAPLLELSPILTIPLNKLVFSVGNVRKTHAALSIEALAESIARRSLLQSLSVRPLLDDAGNESSSYEVQAGQRRLRALHLLVEQGRLSANAPIPCVVKTTGMLEDDSLAENSDRQALHPLDEFRAFAALHGNGMPEDDIAAAYAVTPTVVKQRLRLAAASPTLLEAYAADEIRLEQLMAFCVTDDHARQDELWEAIQKGQIPSAAHAIRRSLTEAAVGADDPRALFVGLDAYVAAGGSIIRDLFAEDEGGYLQDPALLMRLATEKLEAARQQYLAQGWKWAEAAVDLPYNAAFGMRRLQPLDNPLSNKEQKRYDACVEELEQLSEEHADASEIPDDISARMAELEATIEAIDNRPPVYDKGEMARAGVLIDLGYDGSLNIRYGLVRQEDEPVAPSSAANGLAPVASISGSEEDEGSAAPADDADLGTALPDRLIQDLTSYRTIALRDALAQSFDLAFLAVLHAMCIRHFICYGARSCLQLDVRSHFHDAAPGLKDMTAAKAVEARHQAWQARLPQSSDELWATLTALGPDDRADLFAHCASLTVNAVRPPQGADREALRHADQLAANLSLDMLQAGWLPTVDTYFGRITKANILEAVREAKGQRSAQLIDHLKKSEMAKEAERLVSGTGWLPAILRVSEDQADPADADPPADALPEFLSNPLDDEPISTAA